VTIDDGDHPEGTSLVAPIEHDVRDLPEEARDAQEARARQDAQDAADALNPVRRGVVRPYVLTRGRTASSLGSIELHAPVLALITTDQLGRHATPEDRKIVELCQTPTSVAELSARMRTPVGVVRVLIGDLADAQMVQVRQTDGERNEHRDVRMLERLLDGIRAL
jgi:hypothetical protein